MTGGATARKSSAPACSRTGAPSDHPDGGSSAGGAGRSDGRAASRPDRAEGAEVPNASDGDRPPPERAVREHGGAEDFRAVAPPVMSFASGRRR